MPSFIVSFLFVFMKIRYKVFIIIRNRDAIKKSLKFAVIGFIIAVAPKTRVEFTIEAPVKLPKDILGCFLSDALTPNANSGKEVPIAIINKPINIGGTNKSMASLVPYLTTKLALNINKDIPKKNKPKFLYKSKEELSVIFCSGFLSLL